MTNIVKFEPNNLLGKNTGPDNPNAAVEALWEAVHEYVSSSHMGEHLNAYLFQNVEPWLDEFHGDLEDSKKHAIIENFHEFIHEFEGAANVAVARVAEEFEQEFSNFFEELNSGGSAKTGQGE